MSEEHRSEATSAPGRLDAVALFLAAAIPPTLSRAFLLLDGGLSPAAVDLSGLVSDLAATGVLVALAFLFARLSRWLVPPLLLLWTLVHYANYEAVLELGAPVHLAHVSFLADTTFVGGSASTLRRPLLLGLGLLVALLLGLRAVRRSPRLALGPRAAGAAGLVGLSVLLGQPRDAAGLAWRQRSLWAENLASLRVSLRPAPDAPGPLAEVARVLAADLAGEPRLVLPRPGTNVLLLVLESVEGVALPQVAAGSGIEPTLRMASLERLAEEGLWARTMVLHQRQTNRGIWALTTGSYPKLGAGEPWTTDYLLQGGTRTSLPRLLGAAGYHTEFQQGAPLAFMFKGQFLRAIGFDLVEGAASHDESEHEGLWGVDDRTLFRRVAERVDALRAAGRPWFLEVLTVGTHHPGVIPRSVSEGLEGEERRQAAFRYLDGALEELFEALRASGALEDTLVLVTSDESRGVAGENDDLTRMLAQQQGPLVVLEPGGARGELQEPVGQVDLPLSILDYLGLTDLPGAETLSGRSLFRRYDRPRTIFFANAYDRRWGALDTSGRLWIGDDSFGDVAAFRVDPRAPFGPARDPVEVLPEELELARAVVARTLELGVDAAGSGRLELLPPGAVYALDGTTEQGWRARFRARAGDFLPKGALFDDQALAVGPGTDVVVAIELRLRGAAGSVDLEHVLEDEGRAFLSRTVEGLATGEGLSIEYRYALPEGVPALDCALRVTTAEGERLELEVVRAELTLEPGGAGSPGLVGTLEVRRD